MDYEYSFFASHEIAKYLSRHLEKEYASQLLKVKINPTKTSFDIAVINTNSNQLITIIISVPYTRPEIFKIIVSRQCVGKDEEINLLFNP